jgi:hypothetical protein
MSWWICSDVLSRGGRKVLGPFINQELALTVRRYLEEAEHCKGRYWVDEEQELER